MDTSDRSFTDVSVAAGLCLSARGITWLRAHRGIANTIYRRMLSPFGQLESRRRSLGLEPVSGLEYPGHDRQRYRHEHDRHAEADADSHVGNAVEAPAEAADQVDHRVEQRDRLPEGRQHLYRIEAASPEGKRGDDQQRHELQLFEAVGPDADDEADEAERYRRQHEEEDHPERVLDAQRHEESGGRQDDQPQDH